MFMLAIGDVDTCRSCGSLVLKPSLMKKGAQPVPKHRDPGRKHRSRSGVFGAHAHAGTFAASSPAVKIW